MKRILLSAAFAALPLGGASAETVFIGNSFLDFVSGGSACTTTLAVNDTARVIYRPRGLPLGNGANSHLAYVTTRSAVVMRVPNGDFRPGINYVASGIGSRVNRFSNSGGITVWSQTPASIGSLTSTLSIKGRFANFFGISNCIVEFSANLVRR